MQLGSIIFRDFEVEAGIDFGGRQRLAVHRLPNGNRIIDVLGPDAANVIFGGVFAGRDAVTRAQALDALRKSGNQVTLTWNTFQYNVVLSEFSADFENHGWIPYRATCTVVEDDTPTAESNDTSLSEAALTSAGAVLSTGVLPGCVVNPAAVAQRDPETAALANAELIAGLSGRIAKCELDMAALQRAFDVTPVPTLSRVESVLEQLATLLLARAYAVLGVITTGSPADA